MRKKMLFLALALAATTTLTAPSAQAGLLGGGPFHACPVCTTYSDGSQCCITCQCNDSGVTACPAIGCGEI